jgi:hypothetical protein
MDYEFIYRNERYIFTGDLYEYVIGETDELPERYPDRWKYVAKLARQEREKRRRAEHRNAVRGKITVVK